MEYEIVRVVSLSTMEISEITQLKIPSSGFEYLKFSSADAIMSFGSIMELVFDRIPKTEKVSEKGR